VLLLYKQTAARWLVLSLGPDQCGSTALSYFFMRNCALCCRSMLFGQRAAQIVSPQQSTQQQEHRQQEQSSFAQSSAYLRQQQ
jgi:hypothetical protein